MHPYKSLSGKQSGVIAFDIGTDHITVQFTSGEIYTYSYTSCGREHVETMKALAIASIGLSTYIAQQQPRYK